MNTNAMFLESQTLEFKQLWKDDYLKTVCAFANGEGGQLLIGINDSGEVVGIDNIDYCVQAGLPKPEFTYTWGAVRTTFYKKEMVEAPVTDPVTGQVTGQVTDEVLKLIMIARQEMTRTEFMNRLELSSRANFVKLYLTPALEAGLIEMTIPNKPNSRLQKYRLTGTGKTVLDAINNEQ